MTTSMMLGGIRMPQGSARGDASGGKLHIVVGAVHGLRRHDAENGDGSADDAGGGGEDGGNEQHRDIERPAGARQRQLHRVEQALHQARLFHQDAHEDEQRYRGQGLFHHHRGELQRHQVEHQFAETPQAEDHAEKDQGEGDREAAEDGEQHDPDHDQPDEFGLQIDKAL